MATAAFKSTTKRSSTGGVDDTTSSSSGGLRRTRSVSRFSHRLPSELIDFESNTPLPSTRRKFVNTVRGSRFSEISLDDLAVQLFSSGERARSSEIYSSEKRRGRSVSRQTSSGKSVNYERSSGGGGRIGADRRRRSLSVVQFRASDWESHSYSSTLTDDEPCDACYGSDGNENSQSINASKKLDQLQVVQKNQRNNDSQRVPRRVKEDADKIIEDFISSVEDNTDKSSFDGDDTSSALGVSMRPKDIEMDGVVFPWLLWETSNDDIPQFKYEQKMPSHSNTYLQDEGTKILEENGEATSYAQIQKRQLLQNVPTRSRVVYVDDYLAQPNNEDCLLQRWELRNMIKSGGILICQSSNGPILL